MGFQISKGKAIISEINITPFVDVVLVLLVIFMITAPLMYSNIKLQLPKTKKVERLSPNARQVILSIDSAGDFYIGKNKFLQEELILQIKNKISQYGSEVVYIRAHSGLQYGKVAKLMSFLKINGISQLALVTEIEE